MCVRACVCVLWGGGGGGVNTHVDVHTCVNVYMKQCYIYLSCWTCQGNILDGILAYRFNKFGCFLRLNSKYHHEEYKTTVHSNGNILNKKLGKNISPQPFERYLEELRV